MKKIYIFVIIIILYILWISVNPFNSNITKYDIFKFIPQKYKLNTIKTNKNNLYKDLDYYKFKFPYIIKPNLCSGLGKGVKLINSKIELNDYISKNNNEEYIIQEYYPSNYELDVLFEKLPFKNKINITSVTLKYKDNFEIYSCAKRNSCINITHLINKDIIGIFDNIIQEIPNFNAGRFDIGIENINDFISNKNFKIFELNGHSAFDLNFLIKKNIFQLESIYLLLRWFIIRLYIGFMNILLFKTKVITQLKTLLDNVKQCMKCNDIIYLFGVV